MSSVPHDAEGYFEYRRQHGGDFFFEAGKPPSAEILTSVMTDEGKRRVIEVADACCEGRFLYFSDQFGDLGQDVCWMRNPFSSAEVKLMEHWSCGKSFSPEIGDIKYIWEPSRFGWVFWLVRAFALTGDPRYAERFWVLLESWMAANPPQLGPNWQSGQEAGLRCLAVCFATYALFDSPATTPRRVEQTVRFLAEHATRIEAHIGNAIRQRNNHALSEACALWTIGLLLPELRRAAHWRCLGRSVLQREIGRQVYDDGGYIQHSMNYHRLMLQVMTWAARLGEIHDQPLDESTLERIDRAGRFLHHMLDEPSGQAPNYGANDGALVLPLDSCGYPDYRPVVQLARYAARGSRSLEAGPWDESLIWLFGPEVLDESPASESRPITSFDAGGYYILRSKQSWCMIRCHTYRDRPGHIDPLHVDMWWQGVNVLRDAGTFQYYCPDHPELKEYFGSIRAHNTIEIDDTPPVRSVGQFVVIPWPRGQVLESEPHRWQGEHYAYKRRPWGIVHRRTVERIDGEQWCITDELNGSGEHTAVLRWHLPAGDWTWDDQDRRLTMDLPPGRATIRIEGPDGTTVTVLHGKPDDDAPRALESRFYGRCEAQSLLEVRCDTTMPARFVTRLVLTSADAPGNDIAPETQGTDKGVSRASNG